MSARKPTSGQGGWSRRQALKVIAIGTAGVAISPACRNPDELAAPDPVLPEFADIAPGASEHYPFELPQLPYHFTALGRCIDGETLEIHYRFHHQAYVNKLNEALSRFTNLQDRSILELLADLDSVPEVIREAVRNHGGGYLNHPKAVHSGGRSLMAAFYRVLEILYLVNEVGQVVVLELLSFVDGLANDLHCPLPGLPNGCSAGDSPIGAVNVEVVLSIGYEPAAAHGGYNSPIQSQETLGRVL